MFSFLTNILGGVFKSGILNDFLKNRLFNNKTPKGAILLLAGGYAFGKLNEEQINFLITLLANSNISYFDIWIFLINLFLVFVGFMGVWLIFAKVKKKANENDYNINK